MKITPREMDVTNFLVDYSKKHGVRPSYDLIKEKTGASSRTIAKAVAKLERLQIATLQNTSNNVN